MIEWIKSTFFIERFFGVFAYCLAAIIGFCFIKRKKVVLGLSLSLVLLVVISFFYVPGDNADLTRIREMTSNWGNISLSDILKYKVIPSSVPAALFLYYVVAQIGVPGILPAFAALVFYVNVFHIFRKLDSEGKCSSESLATGFLVFMAAGAFLEVISGIRCFMAMSIIARFAFDEIKKKRVFLIYLPFYVIASLLHPMALALSILWIVFSVIRSIRLERIKFVINLISFLTIAALVFIFGFGYIKSMFSKAELFVTNEVYAYIWEYIIGALQLILYAFFIIKTWKKDKSDFYIFSLIILCLMVCLCFEYNIFHRLATFLSFFMIPIISSVENNRYGIKLKYVQWFALLIFVVACVRGNLCGFKFFLLS